MTTKAFGVEVKNIGFLVFGIVLLIIGLVASLYHETERTDGGLIDKGHPYQNIGIILALTGIVFIVLGLLYSTGMGTIRRSETQRQPESVQPPKA